MCVRRSLLKLSVSVLCRVSVCFLVPTVQTGTTWQRGPRRGAALRGAAYVSSPPCSRPPLLQMVVASLHHAPHTQGFCFLRTRRPRRRTQELTNTVTGRLYPLHPPKEPLLDRGCRCHSNTLGSAAIKRQTHCHRRGTQINV